MLRWMLFRALDRFERTAAAPAALITTASMPIRTPAPTRPSSSPATVKMKSVCCSGTKPARVCDPWNSPCPNRPPLPTAMRACSVL